MLRFAWSLLLLATVSGAETVWVAGTEWPPYMGAALPSQGAAAAVVTEAFRSVGVEVKYDFLPWQRTVKDGSQNRKYIGYMPAYYSAERSKNGYLSDQIALSHIGFAKTTHRIIQWKDEQELANYRVGLVKGYVNTPAFDRRLNAGDPNLDLAVSDENNLVKLAAGRIDMALIDRYVFAYYQQFSKEPGVNTTKLEFQGQIVEEKPVYLIFQKNPRGQQYKRKLHEGMQRINMQKTFMLTMQAIVPGFADLDIQANKK
ncbi:transporter substrate-binding domain-containing protein [Leeia sp. TBRC 13508]|uniref:Transporter substrate-binding domain-containing protein n=1 Tax=Leeia speluncae TaxID=2884804 RepID=A0ABS8D4V6_9NEIS|nr:transporter substrate-binding domain-containing protein [Leeia speluncae]MCB6183250.1 transporter substrate-binding domain-containing protein [Leeia speluncae]